VGGAAFFDLDNTLIKGSALFHVGRGMVRHGVITRGEIARHFFKQAGFRWRGERSRELVGVRERALALGAGLQVAEFVALGEQVYDEALAGRIWEGSRQLAHRHLEGGEPVWLVTAAPVELADIVARRLGLTGALGTVAEVKDGAWTGRLVGEVLHGSAKAAAVRALAERHCLDLGQSAAYSDSINDLPLLRAAARPHAVNPDRELRRLAREEGWPIHDFRSGRRLVRVAAPVAVAAAGAGVLALWRAGPRGKRKGSPYEARRAAWVLKKAGVGRRA